MSYEEKCLEADKELATLLGWTNIRYEPSEIIRNHMDFHGTPPVPTGFSEDVPRWTQSDAAAFQLMVEHGLQVMVDIHPDGCDCVEVDEDIHHTKFIYNFEDFPSKAAAVRFAIVKTVIAKLKGK